MNKNIKIIVNYFLGPILFLLLGWSLYRQVSKQPDLRESWQHIINSFFQFQWLLVLLLMAINWGLESKKWKLLASQLEPMSWNKAIRAVLAGCSVTMLTPNRTGEFGGRLFFLSTENRIAGIAATVFGSMSQLLVTLIAGAAGWLYLSNDAHFQENTNLIFGDQSYLSVLVIMMMVFIFILICLLLFRPSVLILLLSKVDYLNKWVRYLNIWSQYSQKELLSLIAYSSLRYIVFILQYLLLLQLMEVKIEWMDAMALIALFYLLMAIVPTIGFTELPVRGAMSAVVLGLYSNNALGIQIAGFSIWLVNLVIPATIGSVILLQVKLMKDK